jgi:hypothetical protein
MTRRNMRLSIAFGLVALVIGVSWFFVDVTARRSSFCSNCHYMTPYVEQWKASTHRNVACVQCHPAQRRQMFAQFVKYVTGTYDPRPRAFVPDGSCAASGCHSEMPKSRDVKFLSVSFPHQPHMGTDRRGIKLHCASCHGSSREAGHVSVDKRICYLCHFKGQPVEGTLTWCGSCHGAPTGMSKHAGFVFDMKSYASSGVQCSRCHVSVHEGDGTVSRDKCFACHVSRVEAISNSKALHEQHVGKVEIRCLDCHEPIRHGNVKMLSVLDVSCESCHANLHAGPKEMYLGVGAKGAPSTPSRMFAAQINCTGCHTQVTMQGGVSFLGQGNKAANPKACVACHDARYVPMINVWKQQGRTLASEARRLADEGARLAEQAPSNKEAKTLADDLNFNARFLEQGHPVHNIEYAIKVVQASASMVGKLVSGNKPSSTPASIHAQFAKDSFSYCLTSCHNFIPRKEPFSFKGVDVPHAYHIRTARLSCDTCHKENQHKQLALIAPSDCASCHHSNAKADCSRCHASQVSFYRGRVPTQLGITAKEDSMSSSVGCTDCHDPTKPEPLKDIAKSCETCHEAKGPKDLDSWRKKLQEEQARIHLQVEEVRMVLNGMERRGEKTSGYKSRLEAARARLDYLEKARGVHNMAASQAIFKKSGEELSTLLEELTRLNSGRTVAKP